MLLLLTACEDQATKQEKLATKLQGGAAAVDRASVSKCVMQLRTIEGTKAAWAQDHNKTTNATPSESDLFAPRYLTDRSLAVCPSGGKYTFGRVGEKPKCSSPGHTY